MTLTKKHIIALAEVCRLTRPAPNTVLQQDAMPMLEQWARMVNALADLLQKHNVEFDRDRWTKYVSGAEGPQSK